MAAIGVLADFWWDRIGASGTWNLGFTGGAGGLVVGLKCIARNRPDRHSGGLWLGELVGLCWVYAALEVARRTADSRRRGYGLMAGVSLGTGGVVGCGLGVCAIPVIGYSQTGSNRVV